jgi:hypothetical protein
MADTQMMDFFDPLIDDELSKKMLKLIAERVHHEDFEQTLEQLLDFLESGE